MSNIKPEIVNKDALTMVEQMAMENEGFTEKPYHDTVQKLTIGYGRNLDDRGITWDEAKLLLAHDLTEAHNVCMGEFAFFKNLNDARKAVVMDLYHNMGLTRLLLFKNMLSAMQLGNFDDAASELKDSRYWNQVGRRARRNYCMIRFGRFFKTHEALQYFKNGGMG